MSYPQFGYNSYSPAVASTLSSQLLIPGSSITSSLGTTTSTSPCDTTPPSPSVGSTQPTNMYSTSAGLLSYPRVAGLADTVYSSAYATQGYVPFGADPSAFYSPLNADNTDAWRSLSGTTAWPYDPNSMTGYPYSTSYGGLDVRRKNATRESTSTLKAWLYEHIKNPYPTKGEKIMLAIITKMTLTQVSTWFANARRRLKKENKMQWSPRNRSGDDDDHKSDDDNDDGDACGGDSLTTADALRGDNHNPHHNQQQHHGNAALNNNNSKSLAGDNATTGSDVTGADDLAEVTTSNFSSFMHSDSSHKNLLSGGHSHWTANKGLDNGQDAFGSLHRDAEDSLRLRRDDDEDIIVDGGDSDPLSRLDFSTEHGLSHSRLKAENDLHASHKLDSYDASPLSQLSTPLGSPSHGLGDSLLNPLATVKTHNHCSNGNDVTGGSGSTGSSADLASGKVTQDMTLGSEGSKPRIWSLADVATSITPPAGRRTPGITVNSSIHAMGATALTQHASGLCVGLGVGANKHAGLTAFSSPVTSSHAASLHNSSFQPWVNGAASGVAYAPGVAAHCGGGGGLAYNYAVNPHAALANPGAANQMNVPTPQRADLSSHSLGGGIGGLTNNSPYGGKLHSNYGDKSSLAQFSSGFTSGPEVLQTAFKPVAKRL